MFAIIFAIAFLPYFYWTILTAPGRVHRMTVKVPVYQSSSRCAAALVFCGAAASLDADGGGYAGSD